jgi:hypothetical protein
MKKLITLLVACLVCSLTHAADVTGIARID